MFSLMVRKDIANRHIFWAQSEHGCAGGRWNFPGAAMRSPIRDFPRRGEVPNLHRHCKAMQSNAKQCNAQQSGEKQSNAMQVMQSKTNQCSAKLPLPFAIRKNPYWGRAGIISKRHLKLSYFLGTVRA